MANIKPGQVAFIKSTEEPAFVLEIKEGSSLQKFPGLSGQVVTVRRPAMGRDGVRHLIEFFSIEELETLEDRHNRQVAEMEELKARFTPNENDIPIAGVKQFGSN